MFLLKNLWIWSKVAYRLLFKRNELKDEENFKENFNKKKIVQNIKAIRSQEHLKRKIEEMEKKDSIGIENAKRKTQSKIIHCKIMIDQRVEETRKRKTEENVKVMKKQIVNRNKELKSRNLEESKKMKANVEKLKKLEFENESIDHSKIEIERKTDFKKNKKDLKMLKKVHSELEKRKHEELVSGDDICI